jgi:hypothetical protein
VTAEDARKAAPSPSPSSPSFFAVTLRTAVLPALVAVLVGIAAYLPPLLSGRIGRDSGVFVYTGMIVAEGGMPYVDSWDHKGPLVALVNAAGWSLGLHTVGVVVLEALLLVVGLAVAGALWARLTSPAVAAISVALAGISYIAVYEGGNFTETWLFPLQIVVYSLAALLLVRPSAPARHLAILAVLLGVALAVAALTRVNNAAGLLVLAVACVVRFAGRRVLLVVVALVTAALVAAPVVVWLWSGDALRAAVEQYLVYNASYAGGRDAGARVSAYGHLVTVLFGTASGMVVIALVAVFAVSEQVRRRGGAGPSDRQRRYGAAVGVIAVVFVADAASQMLAGRDYVHYTVAALAALCVLIPVLARAAGTAITPRAWRRPSLAAAAALAVAVIAVTGATAVAVDRIRFQADEGLFVAGSYQRELVEYVSENTAADDAVLIHGAETWILAGSERRSPTPITYFLPVQDGFGGLPEQYLAEVQQARPPLIVETPESCGLSIRCPYGGENFERFADLVREEYTVVHDAYGYRFWRRIDA